ncbi:MAG: hypothetical protein LAO51_18420 [Acidobacteriia bacterium]|nr:hypothetical protein [Terriglobia bacterium]
MSRDSGAVSYVRSVERALAALSGRPFVLSPRDYARVSDWHARGVPLDLVLETISEKTARHGGASRGSGLALFAPAIEETWMAVRDGRLGAVGLPGPDGLPSLDSAVEAWRVTRSSAPVGSRLRRLLDRLLSEVEAGSPAEALDAELDRTLDSAAPEILVARIAEEALRELEPFRRRMEPGVFEATVHRSISDRLRRSLGLPRIALSRPPAKRDP